MKKRKIIVAFAALLFLADVFCAQAQGEEHWYDDHDGDYSNSAAIKPNGTHDLTVEGKLTNTNSGQITVTADGTVDAGNLDNQGTITNNGTVYLNNGEEEGTSDNTAHNSGNITNQAAGTFSADGDFSNDNSGTFTNKGNKGAMVDIYGDLTNSGTVDNSAKDGGYFSVGGNLNNNSGHISNQNSDFTVDGDVNNKAAGGGDSSIQNSGTGTFTVGGNFTNEGGSVSNQGTYKNEEYTSSFNITGQLENTNGGSIDNTSNFSVDGAVKNGENSSITNSGGSFNASGTGYFMVENEDGEPEEPDEGYSFENSGSITNKRSSDNKTAGTFNIEGTFKNNKSGEVDNQGSNMTFSDTVENDGTIKNSNGKNAKGNTVQGTLNFESGLKNKGKIQNGAESDDKRAQFNVTGDLTNEGSGANIENQGKITVEGDIKNVDGGTVTNGKNGRINAESNTLYNSGTVDNSGNITVNDFYNGYDGNYYDEEDEDGNLPTPPEQNGKFHNQEGGKLTVNGKFYNGDTDTLEAESTAEFDNDGTLVYGDDLHNGSGANSNATFKNGKTGKIVSTDPDSYEEGEEVDNTYYGSIINAEGENSTATFENEGELHIGSDISNYGNTDATKGGTFKNDTGAKLTVDGDINSSGTFINDGTINLEGDFTNLLEDNTEEANEKGGTLTNNGNLTIGGSLDNSNENGIVTNGKNGTIEVGSNVTNDGTIKNEGTFNAKSSVTNEGNGKIENSGSFAITEYLENSDNGSITNSGSFTISEDMTNEGTVENSGTFDVKGDVTTNNGSITNKEKGNFTVDGKLNNTGKDSKVENSGTFTVQELTNEGNVTNSGHFTANGDITNSGSISNELNGVFDTNKEGTFSFTNDGTVTNAGTFNLNSDLTGSSGSSITNSGTFNLNSDASGYEGDYSQSAGDTTVAKGSQFFGGKSSITGGILKWYAESEAADLTMSGESTLDIEEGKLTLKSGDIAKEVDKNIKEGSTLSVEGGSVTLGENTKWNGAVELNEEGELTLNGAKQNGKLTATGGTLDILSDFSFENIGEDVTEVQKNVKVKIEEGVNATLNGAKMHLDSDDEWTGTVTLGADGNGKEGELDIEGDFDESEGNIVAHMGKVAFKEGSKFTLNNHSDISENAEVAIEEGGEITIKDGGKLTLDDGNTATGLNSDTWLGKVQLKNGGTLYYGFSEETEGTLDAEEGDLYLLKDSKLAIQSDSNVKDAVNLHILNGSTVDVKEGGTLNLDGEDIEGKGKDEWFGTVKVTEGGNLKTEKVTNPDGGTLQQDGGKSTFEDSNIFINGKDSYITGGDVELNNSTLRFGSDGFNAAHLTVSDGSTFSLMDGAIDGAKSTETTVDGISNFEVDIHARGKKSDSFGFDKLSASDEVKGGTVNVSDFDFLGGAPIDGEIRLQLFDADEIGENVKFTASNKLIKTPIGNYGLKSLGGGLYSAYLHDFNPQVFRGQVATIAMYANQLQVDDIVTNHFVLHEESVIEQARNANKYSAVSPLFAPYQKTYEDGGVWSKSYGSFERLDLTQGLDVHSNAYGSILGADLPAVELNKDWKFIPTAYVGYNGGHQYFDGVTSYQNGGQLGVMGTFMMNEDFITSLTLYGGGYSNQMSLNGISDETGNWYVGTAVKTAYNFNVLNELILQPNLFMAYNMFGEQNWHTDYGDMSMNSGMLNGINVAPGLNLIMPKKTWSLYATLQYMYFINDKVNGQAGNINLPNVRMKHGYIQYGIGATKTFKDSLAAYGQVNVRNGGINGVGFQIGLNWLFDFKGRFNSKKK